MPRVTLYVKDSDAPIWDRARALTEGSEDSLSSLVSEGLELVVERRERELRVEKDHAERMEPIVLEGVDYHDEERPRKLRFVGIMASEPPGAAVYITRAKKIVVEYTRPHTEDAIEVFDSFDELREAAERRGFDASTLTETAEALGEDYYEDIE